MRGKRIVTIIIVMSLLVCTLVSGGNTESIAKGKAYWIHGSYDGGYNGEHKLMVKFLLKKRKVRLEGYYFKSYNSQKYKRINKTFKMKRGLKLETVEEGRIYRRNLRDWDTDENGYIYYPGISIKVRGNKVLRVRISS